jgi:hypothetical protein
MAVMQTDSRVVSLSWKSVVKGDCARRGEARRGEARRGEGQTAA